MAFTFVISFITYTVSQPFPLYLLFPFALFIISFNPLPLYSCPPHFTQHFHNFLQSPSLFLSFFRSFHSFSESIFTRSLTHLLSLPIFSHPSRLLSHFLNRFMHSYFPHPITSPHSFSPLFSLAFPHFSQRSSASSLSYPFVTFISIF